MKGLSNFLVEKRKAVLVFFLVLAAVSVWLITRVTINSDMTRYLPDDSPMKTGLAIMDEEFPASSAFNLMFKGLEENEKAPVKEALLEMPHVQDVSYEPGSSRYNEGDATLYVVQVEAKAASPEVKALAAEIRERFDGYTIDLSGDALGNTAMEIIPKLAIVAVAILLVILFIMCNSWVEPFLFLATIGIAVVINMGTNVMFESVSDITSAIAAVLQLVLSMDYSIMLLNRYQQEKALTSDNREAMKSALRNAFVSISSSSVTTIVGMLALVFMSFTIGRDMGLVLAKGVFLSLICIFTVLPALILLCDRAIEKTKKKSLHIKMDAIGRFSYWARRVMPIAFVALFALSFYFRGNVDISYTTSEYYEVNRIFQPANPIVLIYENRDEDAAAALAAQMEDNDAVQSVNAYATTLGREMTYDALADAAGMDPSLVAQLYYAYFDRQGDALERKMTLEAFIAFIQNDVAQNEQLRALLSQEDLERLDALGSGDPLSMRLTADEFATLSGLNALMAQQLYQYYFSLNGESEDGGITVADLVAFMTETLAENPLYAQFLPADAMEQLEALGGGGTDEAAPQEMTAAELADTLGMDEDMVRQLFYYYAVSNGDMPAGTIALYDFMQFVVEDVAESEAFKPFFSDEMRAQLADAWDQMEEGLGQLRGARHSRMILNTSLPEESEETFAFMEALEKTLADNFSGAHYLVGNTAMANEMRVSFPGEMDTITILTAVAIFLVVAVAFRSLSIPLILVCIIQCAIFITMGSIYVQGNSIYYLPLLIVQCLLMGATVDYGILYAAYYREARRALDRREAVTAALNNSIHTILTSASILILITVILGFMLADSEYAISEILLVIARGGICSTVLVVFVLPGIMVAFDRFVVKRGRAKE